MYVFLSCNLQINWHSSAPACFSCSPVSHSFLIPNQSLGTVLVTTAFQIQRDRHHDMRTYIEHNVCVNNNGKSNLQGIYQV